MAVLVDPQQALDQLARACLREIADQDSAGRLRSVEARSAVRAIVSGLMHQASGALPNPLEARRAHADRMAIVDALLTEIAAEQRDDRRAQARRDA